MKFIDNDGNLKWERIATILSDTNSGYLSNVQSIEYRSGSTGGLLGFLIGKETGSDVEPDEVGSRLLKSISHLHSITIDHTISGESEEETLHRLSKFTPVVSKLSDQYAMTDQTYRENFHEDIIDICDAITQYHREQEKGQGSEREPDQVMKVTCSSDSER